MREPLSDPEDIIDNLRGLMEGQISNSLTKKNKKELQLLAVTVGSIEVFTFQERDDEKVVHCKNISSNKIHPHKMKKDEEYLILLTIGKNSLQIITDLWDELGTALRNLIIGDYRNVAKSLRWILETVMFSVLISINKNASDFFNDFSASYIDGISSKRFHELWDLNRMEFLTIFTERLKMKQEYGQPKFKSMVNSLNKLRTITSELPSIQNELNNLHTEFSSLIHTSVETIEQSMHHSTRADYSIFQTYEFKQEKFNFTMQKIWRVVDLVITLIIISQTKYYQYISPKDYVDALSNFYGKKAFGLQFIYDSNFTSNLVTMNKLIR